jgi:predicted Fe-Mo cluster-binding NifX family protein
MMCTEPDILQQLLRAGADVNKTTAAGDNCLHIAAMHRCTAGVLRMLVKAGVDVAAVNGDGFTAAEVARAQGYRLTAPQANTTVSGNMQQWQVILAALTVLSAVVAAYWLV